MRTGKYATTLELRDILDFKLNEKVFLMHNYVYIDFLEYTLLRTQYYSALT